MDFVGLNCFNTNTLVRADSEPLVIVNVFFLYPIHLDIRRIFLTVNLSEPIMNNSLQLAHDGLASFKIPRSLLVAAQNGGQLECMQLCCEPCVHLL